MLHACVRGWICLALILGGAPARAADDDQPEPALALPHTAPDLAPEARALTLTERLLLRQQWVMYRRHERASIGVAGPVVGLVLGTLAAAGSAYLFTGNRNERIGAMGLGVFVAAPLLGVSISLLVERVAKRRAIEREIWGAPPVLARGNPFLWTF
jgi:hypothetical protein